MRISQCCFGTLNFKPTQLQRLRSGLSRAERIVKTWNYLNVITRSDLHCNRDALELTQWTLDTEGMIKQLIKINVWAWASRKSKQNIFKKSRLKSKFQFNSILIYCSIWKTMQDEILEEQQSLGFGTYLVANVKWNTHVTDVHSKHA